MSGSDLQHRLDRALRELARLRAENEQLRTLLSLSQQTQTIIARDKPEPTAAGVNGPNSPQEKIALVRRLFRGRDDVYAARWESAPRPEPPRGQATKAVAAGGRTASRSTTRSGGYADTFTYTVTAHYS